MLCHSTEGELVFHKIPVGPLHACMWGICILSAIQKYIYVCVLIYFLDKYKYHLF